MTKIQPPTTPKIAETTVHEASPQAAQRKQPVADTLTTAADTPGHELLQLHLPIPPNLRPIRAHVSDRHAAFAPPSPEAGQFETSGGQAEAVAQGSLGLVGLPEKPSSVGGGVWSSPLGHFDDLSSLSIGGQHTMALLAQIDHHLDAWEPLLHDQAT